jgi:hypothetical protein
MVLSGVAAVSAYEAHLINVTAHVENALWVDTDNITFGTVFPEEWIVKHREVRLSDSAELEKGTAVGDLDYVEVQAFAEWKPIPEDLLGTVNPQVDDGQGNKYYAWLGEALYVKFDSQVNQPVGCGDGDMVLVGPNLTSPPGAQEILSTFQLDGLVSTTLDVGLDVPVFAGYVNDLTDPEPKPSGCDDPSWEIPVPFMGIAHPEDGIDLGLDLKIQVIDIVRIK